MNIYLLRNACQVGRLFALPHVMEGETPNNEALEAYVHKPEDTPTETVCAYLVAASSVEEAKEIAFQDAHLQMDLWLSVQEPGKHRYNQFRPADWKEPISCLATSLGTAEVPEPQVVLRIYGTKNNVPATPL